VGREVSKFRLYVLTTGVKNAAVIIRKRGRIRNKTSDIHKTLTYSITLFNFT